MKRQTQLVNLDNSSIDSYNPSSQPIYQTATFIMPTLESKLDYDYTRSGNPTRTLVENQVASLEQAKFGFGFVSGMAAITCLTGLLKVGEHIIVGDDIYGGTHRLIYQRLISHYNIQVSVLSVGKNKLSNLIKPNTRMIILESPSNPLQNIYDIRSIAAIAKKHSLIFAVDNSVMSPWLQQPLTLGADVVIHSATKFLSGHGDVSGGFLVTNDDDLAKQIAFIQNAEGAALAPFDAWLILRSLKTLFIRVDCQQANAIKVVEFLKTQSIVRQLYYPTIGNGSRIHSQQASGGGSIISFTTGNLQLSRNVVNALKLFSITVSFGSLHSSVSMPATMSHASIPQEKRTIAPDLIRLSIGIEDIDDLVNDIKQAIVFALEKEVDNEGD